MVEDDTVIALVLKEVLSDEGYQVILAADGQEAVDILAEGPEIDLVVTDLRLPYIEGGDIIRMMRFIPELQEIPVIIVTGSWLMDLPPPETYQALIQKPFDIVAFVSEVRRLLRLGSVATLH